jgi:hypothetical protein
VSNIGDDKLRELCQRVVSVDGDFTEALSELRTALRDRCGDIANKNAVIMFRMLQPKPEPDKKHGPKGY